MCTVLLPTGVNPTAFNKYIDINKKQEMFLFYKSSTPFWLTQSLLFSEEWGVPSLEVKRPRRETDHSSKRPFPISLHGVYRDKFTFN
jgi:hypothetical protein